MALDQSTSHDESKAVGRRSRASDESGAVSTANDALHPLLNLQRQIGNAQVARMLAQRAAEEDDEDDLQTQRDPAVQRATWGDDEDDLQMQRDAPEVGLEGGPVSDETAGRIQARRG